MGGGAVVVLGVGWIVRSGIVDYGQTMSHGKSMIEMRMKRMTASASEWTSEVNNRANDLTISKNPGSVLFYCNTFFFNNSDSKVPYV